MESRSKRCARVTDKRAQKGTRLKHVEPSTSQLVLATTLGSVSLEQLLDHYLLNNDQ
jgi:hypothetical protein